MAVLPGAEPPGNSLLISQARPSGDASAFSCQLEVPVPM
jgi:hypothetical protein